jgi:hypothetical protein
MKKAKPGQDERGFRLSRGFRFDCLSEIEETMLQNLE